MTRIRLFAAAALACSLALAGCQGQADAEKDKPLVLTTFTVIADMAKQVAGDHLDVKSITSPDAEIHDYQPKPSDLKEAAKADLILNNGLGLERWFERFVADSDAPTVNLSDGVTPIPIADGESEGEPNPHAWMSTENAAIYVDNIEKAFVKLDPDHKADYEKNAADYKAKIAEVGDKMRAEIETLPENQRVLVTCEGAFSYLARDAHMTEKYLWAVNAEGALKPHQVAEIEDYVRANNVPAVFCESTADNRMKPVVEATDARYGGTLYVDSLSGPDGDVPTYLDLLRYDAETITKALTQKEN